jgi:GcrA cell cycle regulator
MIWDDSAIANLRTLWSSGLETSAIGRRMGVSKNAIVGKAHRLELDPRPNPAPRRQGIQVEERLPPVAVPLPPKASTLPPLASESADAAPAPATISPALNVAAKSDPVCNPVLPETPAPEAPPLVTAPALTLVPVVRRRTKPCSWPIGAPRTPGFRFCDDDAEPGKPYCSDHCKVAFVKIRGHGEQAGQPAHASMGGH